MVVCFDCPPETKEQIDELVASGDYKSVGAVIASAVENLVLIQKKLSSSGEVVIQVSADPNRSKPLAHAITAQAAPKTRTVARPKSRASHIDANQPPRLVANDIPVLFTKAALPQKEPKGLADLPTDMWARSQEVPLDRWVLGQYNRLLPAKVNARALVNLFAQNGGKAMALSEAATTLATIAAELGRVLAAWDEQAGVHRDNALATAFPTSVGDVDKALTRYANQFVVYCNKQGELSGLMIDLKLINAYSRKGVRGIVPTKAAWEFARLSNPVIDDERTLTDSQKFSLEERNFLVSHILESVPVEASAYRAVLEALGSGQNTPGTIDAALRTRLPENRVEELSKSYLASQRSGAVSRMVDLNLVERERKGVRMIYRATKEGMEFLKQSTAS